METQTMLSVVLPFSGFYESLHDSEVGETINRMFSDRATGCNVYAGLVSRCNDACDFREVFTAYAGDYAKSFADEFAIPSLVFERLDSPREYNFETDRIFCKVSLDDMRAILAKVPREELDRVAADMFTSRDGFSSFYSPDVSTWGDLAGWDCNQCAALVKAWADSEQSSGPFDQWEEFNLMESATSNGRIEEWVGNATPGITRLYKIYDYLEARSERS